MNFGVIGEPCIDYIHKDDRETEKKLGGILYAITSLAVISGSEHEIYPIINLGEDEYDFISAFLKRFHNIKHDFIKKVDKKVRVVQLYYKSHEVEFKCPESNMKKASPRTDNPSSGYDREESSTFPVEPVEFDHIKPALGIIDSLYINMVSGIDITLDSLQNIRNNFKGYIHLDSHNIVMRTHPDGQRLREPINDWYTWCTNCDTLQMNETEINIISPEKLNEYEFADKILSDGDLGTKALVVTRGLGGASLYEKKNTSASLSVMNILAVVNKNFKDSTGCGDVFGAGFFYRNAMHRSHDYGESLDYANKLASSKTSLMGVEEMVNLRI